ncbi:hypothetical protein U9M48_032393 [Paspalum notatum var. saurae]|uniref:DNA repair metallo-beta-lactamase domain-containing protein n=1 Tax=Paspalum notatum var. saurae TaxID=547442 RepID=A0AAQ3U516_PASNO
MESQKCHIPNWKIWGVTRREGGGAGDSSLVRRSLFQAWGIVRPRKEGVGSGDSSPSPSHSGSWSARKRRRGGIIEEAGVAAKKPLACPFYKKIPGTPFTVDAFRYGEVEGCSAYFLSHFHHDHYGGLTKKWCHGPIYCSVLTARLVKMCLSVNSDLMGFSLALASCVQINGCSYICPLKLDTEYAIEGVKVTLLEANHCPGAALIHFQLSDGNTYLHTGDFRASKSMQLHPLLQRGRINLLYLDTMYCNPKYKWVYNLKVLRICSSMSSLLNIINCRFPSQEDVIDFVVRTAQIYLKKQPKTLIIVGAYSIGKENVYLAISQALEVPIYTDASRRRILHSFGWSNLSKRISSCNQSSPLHVLPIGSVNHENLKKYLETLNQRFLAVLAFRPTGVPYSEHSSFTELRDFVMFLKPQKIIPTVNVGNATSRDKMQAHFREWLKCLAT